jgi:ABC-type antimicrobial peptide transport system, ATPase component
MKETLINVEHVNQIFNKGRSNEFQALKDINFQIKEKGLIILRGRSGSGKTTLLNILGALDYPESGTVLFDGQNITDFSEGKRENLRRKQFGFVFQSVSLVPMMSAFENVELALRLAGIQDKRNERVEDALKMVGLGSRMHHMPAEMSGGEQQRVAIARAVAHNPRIIFADEPTAELDTQTAHEVLKLFKEMIEKEGITIVMTTHDISLMNLGNALIQLEDGMVKDIRQ